VLLELPLSRVFQPAGLAIVIAEAGGGDVEITVTIEIRSACVGDARHTIGDVVRRELLAAVVLEDDDRADTVVVGKEEAERRDEQIEIAVLVEVHGLDVRRSGDAGNRLLGIGAARRLTDPADGTAQRVADDDVVQAVAIEISDGDVGDLRTLLALRQRANRACRQERSSLRGRCRCRRRCCAGRRRLAATARRQANSRCRDSDEEMDEGPRTTDGPRTRYGPGTMDQGQGTIREEHA
jgi:hypothetical protein